MSTIPFDFSQSHLTECLVIQDKASGSYRLLFLDQYDAAFFERLLVNDQAVETGPPRQLRLALYDLNIGVIQDGKDSPNQQELLNCPEFMEKIVQAKFFNGNTGYSEEELPYLRRFLEKNDPKRMVHLFQNIILQWKAHSRVRYEYSIIKKVFDELGGM